MKKHALIPKHTTLTEKDKKALLEQYGITQKQLPVITSKDPGLEGMGAKPGDIVKIERPSPTAGTTVFYRSVV